MGFAPRFAGRVPPQEREILHHLKAFSLRYHGRLIDQDQVRWQDGWEGQPHLPDLIEVSLTFEEDERQTNQTLLVRPKVH